MTKYVHVPVEPLLAIKDGMQTESKKTKGMLGFLTGRVQVNHKSMFIGDFLGNFL